MYIHVTKTCKGFGWESHGSAKRMKDRTVSKWPIMAYKTLDSGIGGIITNARIQWELNLAQALTLRAILRLTAPTAQQRPERRSCEITSVRSLRFTMSSPFITSAGGRVPRGTGVMATSQGLFSKAHAGPLYLLNHARDGVRRGA